MEHLIYIFLFILLITNIITLYFLYKFSMILVRLEDDIEGLDQVNILVKKPTLIREADRLIFNVENSALVEGSILQVLKSTPGVLVLGDEITVKNSNPTVYINDIKVNLTSLRHDMMQRVVWF